MTSKIDTSRTWLYFRAALFVILTLVAGFFLVVFFVVGIGVALLTGDYTLFVGGIFSFVLFLFVMSIAKKLEPAWKQFEDIRGIKPKTTHEAFKNNLLFIAVVFLMLVFAYVFESYFFSFPSAISASLAREILAVILTIDGILIGFCGVILAQFLWAIHSKGNVIFEQMIMHKVNEATIQKLNDEVERLGRARLAAIGSVFYSMMPLLASILLCLNKLALIDGNNPISPRTMMFDPILALIVGIILLVISTLQTNLLPQTRSFSNRKTTENEIESTCIK